MLMFLHLDVNNKCEITESMVICFILYPAVLQRRNSSNSVKTVTDKS